MSASLRQNITHCLRSGRLRDDTRISQLQFSSIPESGNPLRIGFSPSRLKTNISLNQYGSSFRYTHALRPQLRKGRPLACRVACKVTIASLTRGDWATFTCHLIVELIEHYFARLLEQRLFKALVESAHF